MQQLLDFGYIGRVQAAGLITKLTPEMFNTLISRIEVHNPKEVDGAMQQDNWAASDTVVRAGGGHGGAGARDRAQAGGGNSGRRVRLCACHPCRPRPYPQPFHMVRGQYAYTQPLPFQQGVLPQNTGNQ